MISRKLAIIIIIGAVLSLVGITFMARERAQLDRVCQQEEGLRDEADFLLGKGGWYRIEREGDGRVKVSCKNGGDATVRVPEGGEFGSLIVDCGER
jgi:hypothetical protein